MNNNRGVTLIELIIALAIFSILLILAYSIFFSGINTWNRGEDKADIIQNARFAVEMISTDIRRADKIIATSKVGTIGSDYSNNFGFVIQQMEGSSTYKYILYYWDKVDKIKRAVITSNRDISGAYKPNFTGTSGNNEVARYVKNIDGSLFTASSKTIKLKVTVEGKKNGELTYENVVYIRCPIVN